MTRILEVEGVRFRTHPDVYDPHDDTWLLAQHVATLPPGRLLELGTGTGVIAVAAALAGHEVVATDVNPHALALARANAALNGRRIHVVRADLIRGLRLDRFDHAVMNPPYLPTAPDEHVPGWLDRAFDGGPGGVDLVARLLRAWPQDGPVLWLLASTLQRLSDLEGIAREKGLSIEVVDEQAMPRERLQVLRVAPATRKG